MALRGYLVNRTPILRKYRADISTILIAALFIAVAIALRASTFGDTNLNSDDEFYFLVGQRMHLGAIPYVDVWDRKPLGLFLIYYLIAGISTSVVAYQLAATLFAAATALAVYGMVIQLADRKGAVMAGIAYLALLGPLDGYGGQSPLFYNLFIAAAALLVLREREALAQAIASKAIPTAMLLCGLAITIKQTTIFEAVYLGLWALTMLRRGGCGWAALARYGLGFAALGALPMLAIAGVYAAIGHWPEFWHAMVISNLSKAPLDPARIRFHLASIGLRIAPIALVAAIGLRRGDGLAGARGFLIGWLIAALIGFVSVPNFYVHYALPLLVPLSVAAGLFFAAGNRGVIAFAVVIVWCQVWYSSTDRAWTLASMRSMQAMATTVEAHDHGKGLLVYDGPPYLYAMTQRPFLSPLVFPHHLNHLIERNVSHLATDKQIDAILAKGPGVVVMSMQPRNFPINMDSYRKVSDYIHGKCRLIRVVTAYEQLVRTPIGIYGDCQNVPTDKSLSVQRS